MLRLLEHDIARLLRAAGAPRDTASAWAPVYLTAMRDGAINTPLRVAHFIAQTGHESNGFRTTREYASGSAYEGRKDLGNVYPGDGKRYRGRGVIQLTGRYNHTAFRRWLEKVGYKMPDFDVVANPLLVERLPLAIVSAIWYWNHAEKSDGHMTSISKDADRGDTYNDVKRVTKRINGGHNGVQDRVQRFIDVMAAMRRIDGFSSISDQLAFGPVEVDEPPLVVEPIPVLPPMSIPGPSNHDDPLVPVPDAPLPDTSPVKTPESFWQSLIVMLARFFGRG